MSLQAYKTAATRAESPREMEYRLFGQVTRALMDAAATEKTDIAKRIDALDWNRRVWSTLSTACSDPSNGMSHAVRAQIISLDLFISRHSSAVMRGEEDFETLIDINRMIMQGLAGPSPTA
ncbi:flagellar biosynthesis regulator FlaF [Brevundimonas faecalis]|uniref:Flagellar protein FlaF n=1 Tax=Brevundimonas faecalis TaxID=947378 RepID=A0ABV2RAE6_9CAUL